MAKKKESVSSVIISKMPGYEALKVILAGVDTERQDKFNNMESIEITLEELNAIGKHRWLKENEDGN
jgi:hypothetical protein